MAGVQKMREAFNAALGDQGVARMVLMDTVRAHDAESQVLTAYGMWADGTPFQIRSDPVRANADLAAAARELAERLLKEKSA
jgi:thioesterase domain-containing protein